MGTEDRANVFFFCTSYFLYLDLHLENDLKRSLKEISESRVVSFLYIIYGIAIDLLGKNNLKPCLLPLLEDFITLQRHLFQPHLEGRSLCSRERLKFPTLEIM